MGNLCQIKKKTQTNCSKYKQEKLSIIILNWSNFKTEEIYKKNLPKEKHKFLSFLSLITIIRDNYEK